MNLINDWLQICKGKEEFDSSHFYTLFHNNYSLKELKIIFKPFKRKEEMIERLIKYKNPQTLTNNSEILELVKIDIIEKKKFCLYMKDYELLNLMTDIDYEFVSFEKFKTLTFEDLPQIWLMELIGDTLRYNIENTPINNGIIEAFYGLTTNNNLVWYLSEPLLHSRFNPNPYFEIWRKSGDYILANNKVFILNKNINF